MPINLEIDCDLVRLSENDRITEFVCGNPDLNDFFLNDALLYQQQLLGETYFFRHKQTGEVVAAFTLSNDSIQVHDLPNARKKKVKKNIPHAKSMRSYPAILIGRLGVSSNFGRQGIGTQVLNLVKYMCLSDMIGKSRFLLVDSYNTEPALGLYTKNEFQFLFPIEELEKEYYQKPADATLATRFMYFDLLPLSMQLGEVGPDEAP